MKYLFEVRAFAPSGGPQLASTVLHPDGDVTMRIRPELLTDRQALASHLDEVGRRIDEHSRRLLVVDRVLAIVSRISETLALLQSAASVWEAVQGSDRRALWWLAGAVTAALARWLVPRIVVWLGRRWIERELERMWEEELAASEAAT